MRRTSLTFHRGFGTLARLQARLPALDAVVEDEAFEAGGARMVIAVPEGDVENAIGRIADLTRGQSVPRVVA